MNSSILIVLVIFGAAVIADANDRGQTNPTALINLRQRDFDVVTERIQNALKRINQDDHAKWTLDAIVSAKRELGKNTHFVLKTNIKVASSKMETCDVDITEKSVAIKCGPITYKKNN